MIEDAGELERLATQARAAKAIAIDTEFMGEGRYRTLLCLIQIAVPLDGRDGGSWIELIDPLQQGIVRCKQEILEDRGRSRVVPVCIHGDASFTGQGIVVETLNLSELAGT